MSQKKYTWMIFLIMVLLISDVVLAFFLFFYDNTENKNEKRKEDYAMRVYKEIGLTPVQIDTFQIRKQEFFKTMRPLWGEIKTLKDSLYGNMEKGVSDSLSQELIIQIGIKSQQADSMMFVHFSSLRKLCTDDQKNRFDTIVPKLVNRTWNRNRK